MRTTIALAIVGLTASLAGQSVPADELRLRKVNEHRLVIEGRLVEHAATSVQHRPAVWSSKTAGDCPSGRRAGDRGLWAALWLLGTPD